VLRVGLLSLAGWVLGAGLAVALLWVTWEGVRWLKAPKVYEIEPYVVYQVVALGAGFGAVCGALAGLAGVLRRRDGSDR
jgi:hypothetical protein